MQPLLHVQPTFKTLLFFLLLLFASLPMFSQDRCGTVEYMKLSADRKLINERKDVFEQWIKNRIDTKKLRKSQQRTHATYQIPVVVHVIYNLDTQTGQPDLTNIPDEQILSQIKVLNQDFNRTNTDANLTPTDFTSVAGQMSVEFVLAKQDPEGLETNGIVRVKGTQRSWSINDNYKLKALSYWPAEDYLNIWVCNLTGYIGYAQFPQSNDLSGLENASTNRLTDGVVIKYNTFGSVDDGAFNLQTKYNKGRTATHEIGHFFGLRHIWGDQDNCGTSGDYVADTPDQSIETTGCPAHPHSGCTSTSMFQNYLDYTNDACMNLFTKGQVERMTVVMENSPRRLSLTSSHGLLEPQPVANDAGIRNVVSPLEGACTEVVTPKISVSNYGTNAITSIEAKVSVNGTPVETKTFNVSLLELESTTLTFSNTSIVPGTSAFRFEIIKVNTVTDGKSSNNVLTQNVFLSNSIEIPFNETFTSFPDDWRILNPDQVFTWQLTDAPNGEPSNKAMKMDFYNYEDNQGEIDLIVTPTFDLTDVDYATLVFDVAYARYLSSNDGLQVVALDQCNTDVTKGIVLFDEFGNTLASADPTSNPFTPSSADDWSTKSVDLSQFLGQSGVQLAFVGVNDYGNNVYLDNIRIVTDPVPNITLKDIVTPSPVTCNLAVRPKLKVKNSGSFVTSFVIDYTVNGVESVMQVNGLNMNGGDETIIELDEVSLDAGENELSFTISQPNGVPDVNMNDNTINYKALVNTKTASLPLTENFEGEFENFWISTNPMLSTTWIPFTELSETALQFSGYDNTEIGTRGWLISPTFDLSSIDSAGLAFDVSYATREGSSDELLILGSRTCGDAFDVALETFSGMEVAVKETDQPWIPASTSDWLTKTVSLKELAGSRDARVAFVFQNEGVNNMFIDNVRIISTSANELKRGFQIFPNPVTSAAQISIAYNLSHSDDVTLEIIDRVGRLVYVAKKQEVLNQTEILELGLSPGLYTMRLVTPRKVYTRKFVCLQ